MNKKEVDRSQYFWILYSSTEGLSLSVTCGRSAVFGVDITLTKKEEESYKQQGREYLDLLAYRVQDRPAHYRNRDQKDKKD